MTFRGDHLESEAQANAWNYAFGFVNTRVVHCVVVLEIPDILEKHGGPMSLQELSLAVGCPSSAIHRIMRFLTYRGFFKKVDGVQVPVPSMTPIPGSATQVSSMSPVIHYTQTPVSRLFTRDNMAPFVLLHHGTSPGESDGISANALRTGKRPDLDLDEGGESKAWWSESDFMNHKVFTDAMESHARGVTSAIIKNYPKCFEGVGSLVDVGGRHGKGIAMLVEAFPSIRGINFDLKQVVSDAPARDGIIHVGGSMFESIPKADAVMLMGTLHNWSDEACINILKKCKDAVPAQHGKVLIVDAIIDEEGQGGEYAGVRLALDMVMMAATVEGKERTYEEWVSILDAAGFAKHKITHIGAIESVIEVYP